MSLRLLIDGYNVLAPVAPPAGVQDPMWLHRERMLLLGRLKSHLASALASNSCVVFDAANPPRDRPNRFEFHGIDVRFAVGYPEADDLLEEVIVQHHAPKRLTVVSSDHRVQQAAKRRGCQRIDSEPWLDALLEGEFAVSTEAEQGTDEPNSPSLDDDEVKRWMREFGFDSEF